MASHPCWRLLDVASDSLPSLLCLLSVSAQQPHLLTVTRIEAVAQRSAKEHSELGTQDLQESQQCRSLVHAA